MLSIHSVTHFHCKCVSLAGLLTHMACLVLQMSEVLLSLPQSSWSRTCVHALGCYMDNDIPLEQCRYKLITTLII